MSFLVLIVNLKWKSPFLCYKRRMIWISSRFCNRCIFQIYILKVVLHFTSTCWTHLFPIGLRIFRSRSRFNINKFAVHILNFLIISFLHFLWRCHWEASCNVLLSYLTIALELIPNYLLFCCIWNMLLLIIFESFLFIR